MAKRKSIIPGFSWNKAKDCTCNRHPNHEAGPKAQAAKLSVDRNRLRRSCRHGIQIASTYAGGSRAVPGNSEERTPDSPQYFNWCRCSLHYLLYRCEFVPRLG